MTATVQPVLAYRAKDAVEARALAAHLNADGIDAHVVGEFLQGAYAGLSIGGMDVPEIWVPSNDLPRAQSAIADWRQDFDARANADGLASTGSENAKPFKFQFSTAAMLWLTTCVAFFAATAAFDLVTYANWPAWILDLSVFSLILLVAWKSVRRLRRKSQHRVPEVGNQSR